MKNLFQQRKRRHLRVRKKVSGIAQRPRLSVFRSNKHIYGQLIDDLATKTIIASSDLGIRPDKAKGLDDKTSKISKAFGVGADLAKKAKGKNIKRVVFDRSGYKYHGRVKALAQGAKKGGLIF